jgi:hypothetical protein
VTILFGPPTILSGFVGQPLLAAAGLLAGFFGRGSAALSLSHETPAS